MKTILISFLVLISFTACRKCEMEIVYCDGLSNNNLQLVEYDSQSRKTNLGENVDSIKVHSGNIIKYLEVDGSGMYSKKDSILEINMLDFGNEFRIIFYQRNSIVDTLFFGNVSFKIENINNNCEKKRTSTYPTFHSNSIQLIKSYKADCNNYVFEIKR